MANKTLTPKTLVSNTELDKKIDLVYDFTFMTESLKQIAKSLEEINQTLNIFAMGKICEHVKHMPRINGLTTCKFCGIALKHAKD